MRALKIIFKTIGFTVLGAAIFAASLGFIYFGSGYRYNLKTKKVYRTGLIYMISNPSRANIYLNDRLLTKKTPYKIEGLNPGEYAMRIEKEGFVSWAKTLPVYESIVTWAQYVLLLPNEIPERVENSRVVDYKLSKNGKRAAAIIDSKGIPTVAFIDLGNGETTKTLTITTIKKPSEFRVDEFSEDLNAVLISADVSADDDDREWFSAHTDAGTAINISKTFELSTERLIFKPGSSNEVYWLNKSILSSLNLSTKKVTAIHRNVAGYDTAKGKLYAVITTTSGNSLYRLSTDGSREDELAPAVPISKEYRVYLSTYENDVVILHAVTAKSVLIIPSKGTSVVLNSSSDYVALSPKGRFVTMYNSTHVWTYDFDQKREYSFGVDNLSEINWLFTDFHLLLSENGNVVLSDFDGTNRRELKKVATTPESSLPLKKLFMLTANENQDDYDELRSLDISKSFSVF